MLKKLITQSACTTLLLSSFITSASVVNTITFDESNVQGPTSASQNFATIIDNEYENTSFLNGVDVTFWADQQFDINNTTSSNDLFLTLFNTDADWDTQDPDLVVNAGLGNVAVIHERNGDCSLSTNSCNDPDDRFVNNGTGTNGGYVFAEFSEEVILHSIGLVDMEGGVNQRGEIAFFDENQQIIGNWIDMDVTGNGGYTNQVFDLDQGFTYLVLNVVGSGGFGDIQFSQAATTTTPPTTVPGPSTLVIFVLGLLGLVSRKIKK